MVICFCCFFVFWCFLWFCCSNVGVGVGVGVDVGVGIDLMERHLEVYISSSFASFFLYLLPSPFK